MRDNEPNKQVYRSVYYLSSGLIYTAVLLRSILFYQGTPYLGTILGLLFCFLLLFLVESILSNRLGRWIHLYLGLQSLLIFLLIINSNHEDYDYMSILFAILGMQAMQRSSSRSGIVWITAFFVLFAVPFITFEGLLEGVIRVVLFGSIIIFLSAYAWSSRRAQEAYSQNQSLMLKLQEANLQLQSHSDTLKQLGVAHERQHLARELHDSVTQTIFSMTLTTQSALLLLERDRSRVAVQLERLNQLAQNALTEMHTLISELRPEQQPGGGLAVELQQHLKSRQIPDGLACSLEIDGDNRLSPQEEQGLFRITQEALNNVIKHSQASKVWLHLHLEEPYWIEIADNGQGFDLNQAQGSGRLGLAGMQERAIDIRWKLSIQSTPETGTRIRVEKIYSAGERI
jgi:signal transduction histidine kinase